MKILVKFCKCGALYIILYNSVKQKYEFILEDNEVTCYNCKSKLTIEDLVNEEYFNKEVI